MKNIDNDELNELISLDTFNDTSLFAVTLIDLSTYEVVYANQAMKNIMSDMTATNCWEMIHGQDAPCMWCKAPMLIKKLHENLNSPKSIANNEYTVYEHFNEVANKWYQVQEKVVMLKDSREILVSFALDISTQKEAQSNLIDTHVKLANQTKALEKMQDKLKELANKDPLTNLYNRRYLGEITRNIIAIERRLENPISLVMIDIDKFKSINDTYGHGVGDDVIKFLANKLIQLTRESDIVSRFGGEEFVIVLTSTNKEQALLLAEKIRADIENSDIDSVYLDSSDKTINITASMGVDEFNYKKDTNIYDSINRADKALYVAKKSGRNKVC